MNFYKAFSATAMTVFNTLLCFLIIVLVLIKNKFSKIHLILQFKSTFWIFYLVLQYDLLFSCWEQKWKITEFNVGKNPTGTGKLLHTHKKNLHFLYILTYIIRLKLFCNPLEHVKVLHVNRSLCPCSLDCSEAAERLEWWCNALN